MEYPKALVITVVREPVYCGHRIHASHHGRKGTLCIVDIHLHDRHHNNREMLCIVDIVYTLVIIVVRKSCVLWTYDRRTCRAQSAALYHLQICI